MPRGEAGLAWFVKPAMGARAGVLLASSAGGLILIRRAGTIIRQDDGLLGRLSFGSSVETDVGR